MPALAGQILLTAVFAGPFPQVAVPQLPIATRRPNSIKLHSWFPADRVGFEVVIHRAAYSRMEIGCAEAFE